MLDPVQPSDPWEAPPQPIDPELVESSERLMAKTVETASSSEPDARDATDLKIQQLVQEKEFLFQRNVNLRIEVAQLQSANQDLMEQIAKLKQSQKSWLDWLWKPFTGQPGS